MEKTKKDKMNIQKPKVLINDSKDEIVFVRVVRSFNDATDRNNFISSGPNTFYRTNRERADKLAAAGYVEYENIETPSVISLEKESDKESDKDLKSNDIEGNADNNKLTSINETGKDNAIDSKEQTNHQETNKDSITNPDSNEDPNK